MNTLQDPWDEEFICAKCGAYIPSTSRMFHTNGSVLCQECRDIIIEAIDEQKYEDQRTEEGV